MEGRGSWVVEGSNGPTATRNSLVAVGNKTLRQGPCGAKQYWDKYSLEWPGLGIRTPVSNHLHQTASYSYLLMSRTVLTGKRKHIDNLSTRPCTWVPEGMLVSSHSVSR